MADTVPVSTEEILKRRLELHVICNSHLDREWTEDFQFTRMLTVKFLDSLLAIMAQVPEYQFLLDSQTVPLEDYLEIRPVIWGTGTYYPRGWVQVGFSRPVFATTFRWWMPGKSHSLLWTWAAGFKPAFLQRQPGVFGKPAEAGHCRRMIPGGRGFRGGKRDRFVVL